jgi:hypothetical protein
VVISRRDYWTLSLLTVLGLSVELWLPLCEEAIFYTLESLELILDLFYEKGLGLNDEDTQQATAWTGLLLTIGLAAWLLYKLPVIIRHSRVFLAKRWTLRKQAIKVWWPTLNWQQKLAHIAALGILVGALVLVI